jgi:hypothetical protein
MSEDLEDALYALKNLLASIHRDGGHYTEKHGLTESCRAADERVAWLNLLADEKKKAETPKALDAPVKEFRPVSEQYQRYPDGSVGDWYG